MTVNRFVGVDNVARPFVRVELAVSKALDRADAKHAFQGEWMGNYAYRAPEALMAKKATAESDIYVLGLVAHEILTGRHPYDGLSAAGLVSAQVRKPAPVDASLPGRARDVIERCLAFQPAERYSTVRELREVLCASL